MDQTKVANFINAQNSHRVTFLHGQMQADKIHRMADHERVVHQHLEALFRIHLAIMEMMRAIQAKVSFALAQSIPLDFSMIHFNKFETNFAARKRKCGNCKQEGHTRVKCPRLNLQ